MRILFPPGTCLIDVLQDPYEAMRDQPVVVQTNGTATVRVSPRATRVLVPEGEQVPVR
jgi:hypothetical protein